MAEGKKSVLLYCDLIHTVRKLDNEMAGKLFKHYLSYINDEDPQTDDILLEVVFEPIKQALKRDLTKWEGIKQSRSKAGKISAEVRATNKLQQSSTNPTVSVNDSVTVNVNVINKEKEIFISDCFKYLGKAYTRGNPSTHGIESPIRKWLLRNDPSTQQRNLSAYVKVTPDKKFRAKTIERLLEKLEGYNFCQDVVNYQAPVINGQPKKTKEQLVSDRKAEIEMKEGYERLKKQVGK